MKATLTKAGRRLGEITLRQDSLVVDVEDPTHKAHLDEVFRETGDLEYAWHGRFGAESQPAVAHPNTEMWLHAILFLKLTPEGYRFTLITGDEDALN